MSKRRRPSAPPSIVVRGARTHNLKNVNCAIPTGAITVVTGLSGSGKSSLAFDTLFAEGQRRYVESLSTYARQFIARMQRPDVDEIEHIPPAIALEQRNAVKNARSTIGSATEINDFLRLIFAKIGTITCPETGEPVRTDAPSQVADRLLHDWDGEAASLVAPVPLEKKGLLDATLKELVRQGFTRLLVGDELTEIDDPAFRLEEAPEVLHVVTDRMRLSRGERGRLVEAVEAAYRMARGTCLVRHRDGRMRRFSESLRCEGCPGGCGHVFREPSVPLLNFSSPLGACPTCQGFGRVTGIDWGKVIPQPHLSLDEGAIAPWNGESGQDCLRDLRRMSADLRVRMDVPWEKLTKREQKIVREGQGDWYGIKGFFEYLEERRYKVQARIMIARFRGYSPCPDCGGHRLRAESMHIRVGGLHFGEVCEMSVKDLAGWIDGLQLRKDEAAIVERPLAEVKSRLQYLLEVGLGYLTLSRQTRTLSGGESQRINLATALGSALTETLYVLDEPTVGLHPRDTERLIGVLRRLRDLGNSVLIVEHDLDVIRASDQLIEIGPAAGEHGGEILFQGRWQDLAREAPGAHTAKALALEEGQAPANGRRRRHRSTTETGRFGRREPTGWITVHGASENNLRSITARLPLGVLCCVTGVSGSGKSTLIKSCLYENYRREVMGDSAAEPGAILRLEGLDRIDDVVMIDQSPIGRSSRSNAATYLKAYDQIRTLLAETPQAKALGLKPRDFSFNVAGGRCETCEGTGYQTIDMHFLADVEVLCDVCEGRRFLPHVLEVEWKELSISDILALTVDEAIRTFEDYPRILNGLEPLARVGLGYLRLGQSTATLSGGEAQRLKLASHIAGTSGKKNALLLFDEPTTGLHSHDLDVLIDVFEELLDGGFSLVVIEHNLQLIRRADWVIDLGPDSGEAGGTIVVEGPPEEVAAHPHSLTGRHLAGSLQALLAEKNP